ncbi:MAG: penicillin-binding protein 1A, partial [Thermodesulfobacteriota bacterium]
FMRILKFIVLILLGTFVTGLLAGVGGYYYIQRNLPSLNTLQEYNPNLITRVYSTDGQVIGEFFIERRIVVPLSKMPSHLVKAFIATEDARFFDHEGLDYKGIMRALHKNLSAGKIVQGGSTITQQLVKSFFLTPERSISRKIKEAIISYRIEKNLNKEEILYLYLNQIYLGKGAYGVQAAAEIYFGKNVEELNLAEAALLAGLPKAPSRYSPYTHPEAARRRQEYVLTRMLEEGYVSREDMEDALNYSMRLRPKSIRSLWVSPYFTEHIRKYIAEKYGEDLLYRGGLQVHTTLNVEMQKAANEAVAYGLKMHDRRRGFRGPIRTLVTEDEIDAFIEEGDQELSRRPIELNRSYKALVTSLSPLKRYVTVKIGSREGRIYFTDMNWARLYNPTNDPDGGRQIRLSEILQEGDVVLVKVKHLPRKETDPVRLTLEQEPLAQAALIAIDPSTGHVKAMVGGADFARSEFNRAIQAKRQAGSAFKPIIYAAALDNGYTPSTIVVDSPLVFEEAIRDEVDWKPRNYEGKFYGPTTIRDALAHSRNVITVKVLKDIGVDTAVGYAERLGIESPLNRDLSFALGSTAVSLLDLTTAYATFAALGMRPAPTFILRITDKDGNVLEEHQPSFTESLSRQTSYIITNLLQGVVQNGTGRRAKALNRPVAGKTGTTNNLNDAWFIGYTPDLVAGAWIGYDEERALGNRETGARAALPIWLSFMKKVTEGTPIRNFTIPEGIVFAKIDAETGLPAGPSTKKAIFEAFKEGTAPTSVAEEVRPTHTERFFEMDIEGSEEP